MRSSATSSMPGARSETTRFSFDPAPQFGPFASHCAISVIVEQALRRAGVRCPSRGAAHVLPAFSSQFHASTRSFAARDRWCPSPPLHRHYGDLREGRCTRTPRDRATLAGGDLMLIQSVESYLELRRAMGFALHSEGSLLLGFAKYSDAAGKSASARKPPSGGRVRPDRSLRGADLAKSSVLRDSFEPRTNATSFHLRCTGARRVRGPMPYIFSAANLNQLVQAASQLGKRNPFRGQTYHVLSLLACTGLRVSEAIRLRFEDVTADGLIIRCSKFRKSRLVPLHSTALVGLEQYLQKRRPFAPFDDHVFVSLRRRPLLVGDAETAFRAAAEEIGLKREPGLPRPTIHALRHTFAVRSLEHCQTAEIELRSTCWPCPPISGTARLPTLTGIWRPRRN